ncbi:MAG: carboxypeptidase regulatory-like domain-containing protein [Saprospirales bacterium]|nr:carboxypeptidase regulatory-like domain-containing protein [Saprospirales bacterium]
MTTALALVTGMTAVNAQCTLSIDRAQPSGCYYSGGQSLTTVTVEVSWTNPPSGDITVQLGADTRSISPGGKIVSPQVVAFEIPANGAAGTVNAWFDNNVLCADLENFMAPAACAPSVCPGGSGVVGGKAFVDYNQDGVQGSGETNGQGNVEVRIFECDASGNSVFVTTTTTDINGDYYFTGLSDGVKYRLEFNLSTALLTSGYRLGNNGTDSRTSVQFVTAPVCTADIGVFIPSDFCDANPLVLVPCYTRGNPLVPGSAAGDPALVGFLYNATGPGAETPYAIQSQVGSLWGEAYDKTRKRMYTSAFLRRHTGLGPLGLGGIYVTDLTAPPATSTASFVDLVSLGVNVGTISSNAGRGLAADKGTPNVDMEAFGKIGKVSIGDIDISDDGSTLYFINLFTGKLQSLRLDDDGNPATPYTHVPSDVKEYDFSALITCVSGTSRPFGLKFYKGKVYVGTVCDAQTSQDKSDLRAYVLEFTPGANTFGIIFDFPLTYPKGSPFNNVNDRPGWYPWTDTWSVMTSLSGNSGGGGGIAYPVPMLCDIEFDIDGSMVLGFGDRTAYQTGFNDYPPTGVGPLFQGFAGGDILRVFAKNGTYVLENNAKAGPISGSGANNNQGPGFGEFYNDIWNGGGHSEIMLGGLALRPGSGQVMAVMMDPMLNNPPVWSNGVRTMSNLNGSYANGFVVFQYSNVGDPGTFGKAAGLGDIELICALPTNIQIGNRVWKDDNANGIQESCENPIANVKVELYDRNGNQVGLATTNANGEYYFDATNVDTIAPYGSGGYTGLSANTKYHIVVGKNMTQFNTSVSELKIGTDYYKVTPAVNIGQTPNFDMNDSDGALLSGLTGGSAALNGYPGLTITSPAAGDVNHTYDFAFYQLTDFGDLPDDDAAGSFPSNLTNGSGEGVGASHIITSTLKMGATVDSEADGQPNASANGDDANGDDENGVTLPLFIPGQLANITVNVMNTTGSTAKLTGFFDWNNDKDFADAGEMANINVLTGTIGNVTLSVTVPVSAVVNTDLGLRFRISTNSAASMSATGQAPDGEVEDYLAQVTAFDWGDLPDPAVGTAANDYQVTTADNGPRHLFVNGLKIGATLDFETDGQPSALANGDGADEDGIASFPQFSTGQAAAIDVTVMNMTGNPAVLYGFFDWNKDGDFNDAGEQTSVPVPNNTNGTVQLNTIVPSNAVVNMDLGARFRLSTDADAAAPVGQADDGEVEDYLIEVVAIDYGDLPDGNTPGSYPTDQSNGAGEGIGPCHIINPNLKMGNGVDAEDTGLPNANAEGDDMAGTDDDDAIAAFPVFLAGQSATIAVNVMNTVGAATLYGFFDWNKDGDFADLNESVTVPVPNNTMGAVNMTVNVPANAVLNMGLGARFRLSTANNLTAAGPVCAPDGEVEDYLVEVISFDYGDLPDGAAGTGSGNYQVQNNDNGPSHKIVVGIKIGGTVDGENNGQQSGGATGDGADEDGVASFPQFALGQVASIDLSVMNMTPDAAILYGYFDWNKDGDFEDANEQSSVGVPVGFNGTVQINAYVPTDVVLNMDLGARFRLSTDVAAAASPDGPAPDGEVEDYLIEVISIDYGDLPDNNTANSYPTDLNNGGGQGVGPSHVIVSGIKLGNAVDGESDGQISNDAQGDDNAGAPDDEDGVNLPMFIVGQIATVPVDYMNMTASGAKITLFADWNADGDFNDAGEMTSANVAANTSGTENLSILVPPGATINTDIGVRVRISTNSAASMQPTGPAPDGEVEDYLTQVMAFDWGDLADNGASGYPTNSTDAGEGVGPSHKIRDDLKLGASVDAENDGQPSANADGDGADENGISAFPAFTAGQTAAIPVSVMNMTGEAAILYGFIDWNKDGDFNDLDEIASVAVPDNTNGNVDLFVNVPDDAVINMNLGARFRLSTDDIAAAVPVEAAPDGEVEDYLVTVTGFDYGDLTDNDAPGSYPTNETNGGEGVGACHTVVTGLKIGSSVDNEVSANPSAAANGDDLNGADDEDGIVSFPTFTAGLNANVTVSVMNMMTPASAATLFGFIDWNQDGDFTDPNETSTVSVANGTNGNVTLTFAVPVTAVLNADLGARFRLSTQTGLTATGCAPDGEVEDYYVQTTGVDYGDLPDDNTPGSYPTDPTDGAGEGPGACHTIVTGLKIGSEATPEAAAFPSANADGDDTNGTDDEDGILNFPMFTAGQPATVSVYVMDMLTNGADATLYGFIDWNGDGDFNDANEAETAFIPNGSNSFFDLGFDLPADAVTSSLIGARFRISTSNNLGATGCAPDGEVEDYLVMVNAVDYGDLPDDNTPGSYPTDPTNGAGEGIGPCHTLVTGLKIGATIDGEAGGVPSAGANSDDNAGDDEDGIAMFPMFYAGQSATVAVSVMNMLTNGDPATLYGFIDWNLDGDFDDAGEAVSAFVANSTNGVVNLTFNVPLDAVINTGLGARFRLSTVDNLGATGCAPDGEVEDYIVMAGAIDFGDLPDDDTPGSYPTNPTDGAGEGVGACHALVDGLKIGSTVDPEGAALPSENGDGDDNNPFGGPDDEDGIAAFPMFLANQNATVSVQVMNMMTPAATAYLYGFADWNQDGDFDDPGESVSVPVSDGTNGIVNLSFSVPANAVLNEDLGIRFRISTDDDLTGSGCAPDGEVEDYLIQVMAFDYGDLADNDAAGSYPTNATDGGEGVGPSHKILDGLKMGPSVDFEPDGQSSANADGDDNNGDDENGIASFPAFEAGTPATITVNVMNMMDEGAPAVLYGYIDWNKDGDFDDPEERFSTTVPDGTNGDVNLNVNVPEDAVLNMQLGARFRLSTDDVAASTPEGPAPNGEVEDYLVSVLAYDYGDLPDNNTPNSFPTDNFNGGEGAPAKHQIIAELRLGSVEDAETDGQPDSDAKGDDDDGAPDDEDGVVFATPLVPGYTACLKITAQNSTGSDAYLQAWMDFNGNGKFDAGEMLTTGDFSAAGAIVPNGGVTDQDYCFTVPVAATFEGGILAARFRLSSAGSLGYSGTTNTGEVEDYLLPLAKIGNLVWEDVNGNGMQDEPGSDGINGVGVQLTYAGPDNDLNNIADNETYSTVTSSMTVDGQYMFVGLIPGTYEVGVPSDPAGFTPTGIDAAGDEIDSDDPAGVVFTIPDPVLLPLSEDGTGDVPGVIFPDANDNLTFDFGYYEPASIGDYAWIDEDGDGIQDPGEDPLPNVKVVLTGTDGLGNPVMDMTTTDANGEYLFDNLVPGEYKLTFTAPNGSDYVPTDANQGNDDTADSDADPAMGGMTVVEVLTSGENNDTYDAGYYEPAEIGNYAWIDDNANGIQDPGEDPLPGVTVVLDGTTGAGEPVNLTAITDANGLYLFDNLQPGEYKLTFQTPLGGYVSTTPNDPDANPNDTDDSDADPAMGGMTVVEVLTTGESNMTYDAGYFIPASIGDYVWADLDADGIQDTDEPGIVNAEVILTGTDGQGNPVSQTTYTDANGYYLFDNLVPGSYKLTFVTPAGGYVVTDLDQGGDDAYDSDADPNNGNMTVFETLTSGEHNPDYDAGFYVESAIGNYVWEDLNANGLQDQGEPGIENVEVTLTGTTGSGEPVNLTDFTDANGLYLFAGLQPGTYKLTFGTPGAPYVPTEANDPDDPTDALDSDADPANAMMTVYEVLEAGEVNLTYDAGFYQPASIGDYTWIDEDGDGIQDPGEDPLPGITVTLTGTDGQGNPVNLTDVTDANGEYSFDNLVPGEYKLTFPLNSGTYVVTDLNQGNDDATDSDADPTMNGMTVFEVLTSGEENLTYDAGYYAPAEIGNYAWIDDNANGIQDPGEDPLPGVTVVLDGTTGSGEPVNLTAITDANGLYLFDNLQPGEYKLTFQTPLGGYVSTTPNDPDANPNDTDDSDADPAMGGMTVVEVLTTGESNMTYDAGYFIPASIGDYVWADLDADGIQDTDEPGIVNAEVMLTGTDGQGQSGEPDDLHRCQWLLPVRQPGTGFVQTDLS